MDILYSRSTTVESGSVANLFDGDVSTNVTGSGSIPFTVASDKCNAIAFFGLDAIDVDVEMLLPAASIEAVSKASPANIQITAHGLSTGDDIRIASVVTGDWVGVNGDYEITKVDDDNFTIVLDTSAYSTDYAGGTNGGAVRRIEYTESIDLTIDYSTSWSEFFSQDVVFKTAVISGTMPYCADSSIVVSINKAAGTAGCAVCIVGRRKYIGGMLDGAKFGRDWVKRVTCAVRIPRENIDTIHKSLTLLEDTKAVFLCQNDIEIEAGLVYGEIYDFNISAINNKQAIVSLEIEGDI